MSEIMSFIAAVAAGVACHYIIKWLVLPCGNSGEFSTCSLRQCCVVISQRCHRIASFFRLALTQISGTAIHRYFRKAVLDSRHNKDNE